MFEQRKQKDFLWGVLLGGTIAALTSALFTTKKGKQIQQQIGEAYAKVSETMSEILSESKEKVEETAENVSKKIGDSKDKLEKEAKQLGKKVTQEIKND